LTASDQPDHRRRSRSADPQHPRSDVKVYAERLELALDAAKAGVFEMDLHDRTFWCSAEFAALIDRQLTVEEAFTRRWAIHHPDDLDLIDLTIREAREAGTDIIFESRIVLQNGESRWLDWRVKHKRGADGRRSRVIGLALDIDERKQQQIALIEAEGAAQAAAEAKAQFLANMSHEIRTPMNGVLGVLQLLEAEALSPSGRQLLAEARACGQMLAQLLDDVIDFSRIEAGRLELSPQPMDAADILESVVRLLTPQAVSKGLRLNSRVAGGEAWIMADPVRLRQALFNLLGNAVKFTDRGQVQARLLVKDQPDGRRRLRFEIADTGVGIPAAAQASLFQRFQQADETTHRRFGGSGLGLAITRTLAELMGGEVGFRSREGRGSTFWIELTADPATPAKAVAPTADGLLDGTRILVVEDNATNRLVVTMMLQALGAQVETASDGALGLKAVQDQPFDLVLMDVRMPHMDGMEATRLIRALPGQVASIPIIGLTANALAHQWREYRAIGMDGVVAKPITVAALVAEIARVLAAETPAERQAGTQVGPSTAADSLGAPSHLHTASV
jgi:PAS domain S-box-containing protein